MALRDPSSAENRPTSTDDRRPEESPRLTNLAEATVHLCETLLNDLFCLCLIADECLGESDHAVVFGMEQILDCLCINLFHGHSSH